MNKKEIETQYKKKVKLFKKYNKFYYKFTRSSTKFIKGPLVTRACVYRVPASDVTRTASDPRGAHRARPEIMIPDKGTGTSTGTC